MRGTTGKWNNKHITPRNSIPSIEGSKNSPSRGRSPLHSSSIKLSSMPKPNNSFNVGTYEGSRVSSAMYQEGMDEEKTSNDYSSSPSRVIR